MTTPTQPDELQKAIERIRNELLITTLEDICQFKQDIKTICSAAEQLQQIQVCSGYRLEHLTASLQMLTRAETAEKQLQQVEKERGEWKVTRLNAGQKIAALRTALSKAHDAMCSWFSSEYAAHPISKQIRDALYNTPKENIEQENDTLKAALEKCAKALQQLWEDDEMGYIVDETHSECVKCGAKGLTALPIVHEDGCVQGYIRAALSDPTVQAALNHTPSNHPTE